MTMTMTTILQIDRGAGLIGSAGLETLSRLIGLPPFDYGFPLYRSLFIFGNTRPTLGIESPSRKYKKALGFAIIDLDSFKCDIGLAYV